MRWLIAAVAVACISLVPFLSFAQELQVGQTYRTSVRILDNMGDIYLPLPEGEWRLIGLGKSSTNDGKIPFLKGRFVMTELDGNRRPRAFITFAVATEASTTGWAKPPLCARKDLNFVYPEDPRLNIEGGQIDCWAVYPVTMRPDEKSEQWLLDAYKWVGTNTAGMPLTTIVAQYVRASGFKILDVSYMFNPEAQGFKRFAWPSWDRARILSQKHLVAYVERVHQFAIAWKTPLEHGFAGKPVGPTEIALPIAADPLKHAVAVAARPRDIKNVMAVPYMTDSGRKAYKSFLSKNAPRAFAISPSGAWGWADKTPAEQTVARALQHCNEKTNLPCKLYAVDDKIVWDAR